MRTTETVGCIERVDEHRHVPIPVNPIPAGLGEEQGRSDPPQTVIAALPAFDLLTNAIDDGESTFDTVGAGEGLTKLRWQSELRDG